jgi:hypothetical protein
MISSVSLPTTFHILTMLSSTFRRAATAAASRSNATINIAQRTMAMGPAQG